MLFTTPTIKSLLLVTSQLLSSRHIDSHNPIGGIQKGFEAMTKTHNKADGGSSIIRSIGGAIYDTSNGVGDLDEKLDGSLGKTSLKVIDSPSGAIKNTGTTIQNTFQGLLGGISGTVKWTVILLLFS